MDYFELQEAVFNHLLNKHGQDNSFTFSVRQVASKGAEKNRFIGTNRSSYFGFTCWDIPVYYPGSSSDLTNFIFSIDDGRCHLKFQYIMAKSATGVQSEGDLAFGYTLRSALQASNISLSTNGDQNKMLYFHVDLNPKGYPSAEEVADGFEKLYATVAQIVDDAIEATKPAHPDWQAGRYSDERFAKLIDKMHGRIQRFEAASPQELARLPYEESGPYFIGGAIWNGTEDQTTRFLTEGIWENGYETKFQEDVNAVPTGSRFAIKSSFAKGRESILRIKATGTVIENYKDGRKLKIDWDNNTEPFDLSGLGGYRQTFHEVSDKNDIEAIFFHGENRTNFDDTGKHPVHPLNTILYGPPGTGKTYNTTNKAVAIANPGFVLEGKSRSAIKEEYNRLVLARQIQFVTFHQSMSYEDFIEGIKPVEPKEGDTFLKYRVEDGIFKRMVEQASYIPDVQEASVYLSEDEFAKAVFYSFTLNTATQPGDKAIYRYCLEKSCIALNVAEGFDAAGKTEADIKGEAKNFPQGESAALAKLVHHLKNGNYILLCDGESTCRAIGRLAGEYNFKPNEEITPDHFRAVEWLVKNVHIPREQLYTSPFTYGLDRLDRSDVKKDFFTKKTVSVRPATIRKNYVLIIDEINRGNVSQIFGELITLIEEDKRKGKNRDEALTITLPYSKKPFAVPDNLYLIGTMNTADRSVEALDTALRRRFLFEEMMPKPELISIRAMLVRLLNTPQTLDYDWDDHEWRKRADPFYELVGAPIDIEDVLKGLEQKDDDPEWMEHHLEIIQTTDFTGVNLEKLLNQINKRLEVLLNKDHSIGHAWLMEVYSLSDLQTVFKSKLLPLLQEYFYNNYAKIGLVLGDRFFDGQNKVDKNMFASFRNGSEIIEDYNDKILYSFKNTEELTIDDFKSIYE